MPALLTQRQDDLLFVTLNQPEKANALSPELLGELTATYKKDWRSEGVRGLVLSATGRHFSAGADLAHLRSLKDASLEDNRKDSAALRELFESVLRQETLTVALVHGACVAGGCGLASAHDFVVASEDARFMYSEVRIGFVAALVATFLPLRLRGSDIRNVLLNPEFLSAREAQKIGLIDRIAPEGQLHDTGTRLALEILTKASGESVARSKRLLLEMIGRDLGERLELAQEVNARSRLTEDCKRGIAHFLEHKKTPDWRA